MKRTRKNTGPDQATRDLVYGRDGMHCVICGESYLLQQHHRAPRKAGGTSRPEINSPANLITLCSTCHSWVESDRTTALDRGFLVPSWRNPADIALIHHGVWSLLTHDGRVIACDPPSPLKETA